MASDQPKAHVFLSYPREDSGRATDTKAVMLDYANRHFGDCVEIFMAPETIRGGVEWVDAMAEAIKNCNFMVVLWTPDSERKAGQLVEVGAAWILNKLFLTIPRGTSRAELPPILERYQAVDSWDDFRDAFLQMLDAELKKKDNGA